MIPRGEDHGVVPSEDFTKSFSDIASSAHNVNLEFINWSNLPSPHMTPLLMFKLARDIDRMLQDPKVIGAVVLHGTDVIVESAYMADLILTSVKPLVYTGSMRYYSEMGYDGVRNLINAIKACLLPLPAETGVVLLMTDRIFSARDVVKINSLNIDAFEAPESGPVAYVAGEEVLLTRRPLKSPRKKRPHIDAAAIEPNVPLLSCYTGMDGSLIACLKKQGIAGLVMEGFGAGNVPAVIVPILEDLIKDGIPVVLTTQCPEGGVWPLYAYPGGGLDLAARGVILGGRLSGSKARIKLMAILGVTRSSERIREMFRED